jgi:hypothetical protein
VDAYEEHFRNYGRPLFHAQFSIAQHGWEAAELMAQYVAKKKYGLPRPEAVAIIRIVQENGCSLKGTSSEEALKHYLKEGALSPAEKLEAEGTLAAIENNSASPDSLDNPKHGPCRGGKG